MAWCAKTIEMLISREFPFMDQTIGKTFVAVEYAQNGQRSIK